VGLRPIHRYENQSTPTLASNKRGTYCESAPVSRASRCLRRPAPEETISKSHQASANGTVTGLKGRRDRKSNDSQEQAAQDQGHRVGNPQAFRQHRGDHGNDEQPNQEFYARGWRNLRNAPHSNCSNSLTNAWRIATRKSTFDLWT
jgi:hypothetical protein